MDDTRPSLEQAGDRYPMLLAMIIKGWEIVPLEALKFPSLGQYCRWENWDLSADEIRDILFLEQVLAKKRELA